MPVKLVVSHEHDTTPKEGEDEDKADENSSRSTVPSMQSAVRNAARSRSIMERDIDLDGVREIVVEVDDRNEERTEGDGNEGSSAHLGVKRAVVHSKAESSKSGAAHHGGDADGEEKAKRKKRKKRVSKKSKK